jgi:Calcineurin-like phosphoesterase
MLISLVLPGGESPHPPQNVPHRPPRQAGDLVRFVGISEWEVSAFIPDCSAYHAGMKRRNFIKITLPIALGGKASASAASWPDLTFGVIADPQYADVDPIATRFYRNSLVKLAAAVAELNKHPLAFTATLGDLIDRDFASFRSIMEVYAKLASPHHPILGNHDFSVADADKGKVLAALGMDAPYYSRIVKGWRFVFLDGTDTAVWRQPAGDPRTAAAKTTLTEIAARTGHRFNPAGDTAIGGVQMAWLEKELDAAARESQRVIVFNHYPVFPAVPPNLLDAADIVTLIGKHPHVAAYMNGHNHRGNYGKQGHCHYVNLKGMVETEKETAYAVVKCFPDRLEIKGWGLEPDRSLTGA